MTNVNEAAVASEREFRTHVAPEIEQRSTYLKRLFFEAYLEFKMVGMPKNLRKHSHMLYSYAYSLRMRNHGLEHDSCGLSPE